MWFQQVNTFDQPHQLQFLRPDGNNPSILSDWPHLYRPTGQLIHLASVAAAVKSGFFSPLISRLKLALASITVLTDHWLQKRRLKNVETLFPPSCWHMGPLLDSVLLTHLKDNTAALTPRRWSHWQVNVPSGTCWTALKCPYRRAGGARLTFTLCSARLSSGQNRWGRKLLMSLTSISGLVSKSAGQSEEANRSLNLRESLKLK